MAGKRKINSEVDSESKKSKNEEWDIYQTEAFLHFGVLSFCTTADYVSQSCETTSERTLNNSFQWPKFITVFFSGSDWQK